MVAFSNLPSDVLYLLMDQLEEEQDINSLSRTSRAIHHLANPCLYRRHARRHDSWALRWAAENDRVDTAKKLLAAGADPCARAADEDSLAPIAVAAKHGSVEVTKLLFETEGVDPEWTGEALVDVAPIVHAARGGHEEVTKLYLANPRVDPSRAGIIGRTALAGAAGENRVRIIELLLADERVDPLIPGHRPGRPPLLVAAATQHDHTDVLRLLLADSRIHVDSKGGNMALTALHLATIFCNPIHVSLLLSAGADVNSMSNDGLTALHLSFVRITDSSDEITELLLAAPGMDINATTHRGQTVLMALAESRIYSSTASRIMGDKRLLLNLMDDNGNTALSIAALRGRYECVRRLLALDGIDVNAGAERQQFVLHHAVRSSCYDTIEEVLRDGRAYTMGRNQDGQTPFILAAAIGFTDIMLLLYDSGRCIRKGDVEDWEAAFISASEEGHRDTVEVLLNIKVAV